MATISDAKKALKILENMQAVLWKFLTEAPTSTFASKALKPVVVMAKHRHQKVTNACHQLIRRIDESHLGRR